MTRVSSRKRTSGASGRGSELKNQKRKKSAEIKSDGGRLVALPIRLCEPHPDLQTRLKYDQVDKLAEDIRVHGQLQPGRAVEKPDGTGYRIYMGIGRLRAVRKLFDEHGEPKSYFAILDGDLPFIELFSRSMSENLERRNLSVLEEVRSYYMASQKASEREIVHAAVLIGEDPSSVRKKIELAKVYADRLGRLYDVEARSGFRFQVEHLEALSKVEGERALYEAAAAAANARFNAKELQSALRHKSIDKLLSGLPAWFLEIFPEYAEKKQEQAGGRSPTATGGGGSGQKQTSAQEGGPTTATTKSPAPVGGPIVVPAPGSQPPPDIRFMEDLHFAACPHCGAMTPFEMKEDSELTVIDFEGVGVPKKDAVAPDGSYRRTRRCLNRQCGREFWLWTATVGGELRAETRRTDDEGWFAVPAGRPMVGSISWSGERKSWVVREKGSGERLFVYGDDRKFAEVSS